MSTQIVERMAVEIDGVGEAVIMVHGLGGTSNAFQPQLGAYAGKWRVIRPDLAGSGRSAFPAAGAALSSGGAASASSGAASFSALSIDLWADALVRMARAIGAERAHWVGHSLGTVLCQHIAAAHPGMVKSLALFGPILAPADAAREAMRARARQARAEGMAAIADAVVAGGTSADTRANQPVVAALVREMVMRQPPEGYAQSCEALAAAAPAALERITCPVLLATGDEDAIAPPSSVRAMAERLAGARATVFPRCGHWTTLERAADSTAALRGFHGGRF